jgi:DNA-binding NarL/FixJ family response regulator
VPDTTLLVAEDFDAFRDFVCRELQRRPDFHVVAVADGKAAVEEAERLRPALALLDIGLPMLNGFEAARRIRARCPECKIVFLTQESSPDVVDEAFGLGAQAYIHKLRAHGYLLAAVEGILEGRSSAAHTPLDGAPAGGDHQVQFYSGESILLDGLERFVASALTTNDAAVVLATRPHVEMLHQRLRAWGVNVERALKRGTLVPFDAAEMVSWIVSEGAPNYHRFVARLTELIASAAEATAKSSPRVAVFGECVGLLCAAGHLDAAIGLETVGNDMLDTVGIPAVDIMCAYPLHTLKTGAGFRRICAEHTTIAVR